MGSNDAYVHQLDRDHKEKNETLEDFTSCCQKLGMDPLEEAKGKKHGELNMLHRRLWSLRRLT